MKEPMKVVFTGTQTECKAKLAELGFVNEYPANRYLEFRNEQGEESFVCENGDWKNFGTFHWPLKEYILNGTFSAILFWG